MSKFKLGKGASSDAIVLMLIKLVTICLGFVVTRLLSQYLTTYDYGTYSQVLLMVTTISSLTILGMIDGVNYFNCVEQDAKKREAYIATLFAMQCIVSTVTGSVLLLMQEAVSAGFQNPEIKRLLIFAAALPLLQNMVSMLQILMLSVGKARMIAIRNLIVSLTKLAAVIVVVAVIRNVAVILTVTVLLDLAQIGIFLLILKKNQCVIRVRSVDFSLTRQILQYCVPMAVFTMISTLNRDCDKFLIALLTDTQTLAVYANASKVLPFDIIMYSFTTVLMPQVTRFVTAGAYPQAVALYRQFLETVYISTTILCCAALSAAPQLMELLYSAKYLTGLTVFGIYILVDLLRFTNITLIMSAAGKTKTLMLVGMGALSANAVLNILLFRGMGMTGPAVATLLTTFATGVLMLHLSARELGTKIGAFFDVRYLLLFVLENLAAMAVFSGLQKVLVSKGLSYFTVLVVVCGLYGVTMLLLNGKRMLRGLKEINRAAK